LNQQRVWQRRANELLKSGEILESLNQMIDSGARRIDQLLRGLSITGELSSRVLDNILSFGEFFALHTVNHFLQDSGFKPDCIDASNIIVSDGNHGKAKPLYDETIAKVKENLIPKLKESGFVLTQGFVAKNLQNDITTMGIESSNLTAALLANILNAEKIIFWTDVEGFRTADPQYVKNTLSIPKMSYSDGYKAAVSGLKLFYPLMIDYAAEKDIELVYRSAFTPEGDFTSVTAQESDLTLPMIVLKENLLQISIKYNSASEKADAKQNLRRDILSKGSVFSYSSAPSKVIILLKQRDQTLVNPQNYKEIEVVPNCAVVSIFNISDQDFINTIFGLKRQFREFSIIRYEFDSQTGSGKIVVPQDSARYMVDLIHDILVR
jgi:aspartate kinase